LNLLEVMNFVEDVVIYQPLSEVELLQILENDSFKAIQSMSDEAENIVLLKCTKDTSKGLFTKDVLNWGGEGGRKSQELYKGSHFCMRKKYLILSCPEDRINEQPLKDVRNGSEQTQNKNNFRVEIFFKGTKIQKYLFEPQTVNK
jgi:hypothetical protein